VTAADTDSRVLVRSRWGLGRLTLNRPEALNALDLGMVRTIAAALTAWRDDPDVSIVLIDGAGERGLCAGGDVRSLWQAAKDGRPEAAEEFFREEYTLNAMIAEYPKTVVAIADGFTMGGGIGLAGHAAIRVVTERSKLAMPETRIGFVPDVGGTKLLADAPGRLGEHLGLTGAAMNGADAIAAGFADHWVPSDRLPSLIDAFESRADPSSPTELVLLFDETPEPGPLAADRAWIDDAYAADDVRGIVARLRARDEDAAHAAADTLAELSPTAVTIALESIRRARGASLRDVLSQEYELATWFTTGQHDFIEGIRAQLVDKDRQPKWNPASIDDVADTVVDEAFSHPIERPLWA